MAEWSLYCLALRPKEKNNITPAESGVGESIVSADSPGGDSNAMQPQQPQLSLQSDAKMSQQLSDSNCKAVTSTKVAESATCSVTPTGDLMSDGVSDERVSGIFDIMVNCLTFISSSSANTPGRRISDSVHYPPRAGSHYTLLRKSRRAGCRTKCAEWGETRECTSTPSGCSQLPHAATTLPSSSTYPPSTTSGSKAIPHWSNGTFIRVRPLFLKFEVLIKRLL